jgi:hypothetical protein
VIRVVSVMTHVGAVSSPPYAGVLRKPVSVTLPGSRPPAPGQVLRVAGHEEADVRQQRAASRMAATGSS